MTPTPRPHPRPTARLAARLVARLAGLAGLTAAAGALILAGAGTGGGAAWAAAATPTVTTISVAPTPGKAPNLTLSATVTGDTATPVDFYVTTTLFGNPQLVPLGSATPAKGVATLTWTPTWTGNETFTAAVANPATGKIVTKAAASYTVTAATPGMSTAQANTPKPLATFGRGMVGFLLAIVFAIWATLLATLWRVSRGVAKHATT